MMKCKVKLEYQQALLPNKKVSIGVKKSSNILMADYESPLKRIGGGVTVNPKKQGQYFQDEHGRTQSVATSWLSVWDNSPIQTFFIEALNKKLGVLVGIWFSRNRYDEMAEKKAANSIRAIYMQAYVAMSKWYTVTIRRGNIKRFNDYGIDTGQTLEATAVMIEDVR